MQKKKEKQTDIPSSSMADIAFLLLVFFLLTTTIDMEKGLKLNLPDDDITTVMVHPKNLGDILINSYGQITYEDEDIELEQITQRIRKDILENPKLIIQIRISKEARYQHYIAVLDRVKAAKAMKISILFED